MSALHFAPHIRRLGVFSAIYVFCLGLDQIASGTGPLPFLAGWLWLGLIVAMLILDWRGVVSLAGWIPLRRLPWWAKFLVILALGAIFPFSIGVYLARAIWASVKEGQRIVAQRPERIAKMERELGV